MEILLSIVAIVACVIIPVYLHFANRRGTDKRIAEENRKGTIKNT